MALPAQPNFLTLACRDVERTADLLRAFGWSEAPSSEPARRRELRAALRAAARRFRAFTLGINLARPEEVDDAYAFLQGVAGVELLEAPFDSPHGFRGFSFRDPEGNIWDVAWKRGSKVTAVGDLTWN